MSSTANFQNFPTSPQASSDNDPTVIVVVFISFGCIIFLVLCFLALWCLITRRKKKAVQEIDRLREDKHLKVKEDIAEGSDGAKAVVLSIEEDKHIEEEIMKNEKVGANQMHAKFGEIITTDIETGDSSSNPNNHHTHHLQHKH